ncbi:MAG: HD domain-containing protein [Pirellulales bacterium]|nr:HD domain-containing protein [Pirellulales bacterium]
MSGTLFPMVTLSDLVDGQEADVFVMMTSKESLTTRDGKPYFKVGFRDADREVSFPIWNDSPWANDCRDGWQPGDFYKVRCVFRETNYGPQLDIKKIRPATPDDAADGFDPDMLQSRSRFDSNAMFDELRGIAEQRIDDAELCALILDILDSNRDKLLRISAAKQNHHAFAGGYLEHVLSVTRACVYLADKYDDYYPDLEPRLSKELVVSGAILHDIGKLRELQFGAAGAEYTASGNLIGHILQGRDIVREAAANHNVDEEKLLRLEHIIVSHQRLPEWGSSKPPMTPEALIVHYADDLDAKYHMMFAALRDDTHDGPLTSSRNPLRQKIYRGGE